MREALVSSIRANIEKRPADPYTKSGMTRFDKVKSRVREVDSSLIKIEQVLKWADDYDPEGAWTKYVFNSVSEAQTKEFKYTAKITAVIDALVKKIPKEVRSRFDERVSITGHTFERALTRRDLIGVALNTGTESNYEKMKKGRVNINV